MTSGVVKVKTECLWSLAWIWFCEYIENQSFYLF
jgi:hypothetical protein